MIGKTGKKVWVGCDHAGFSLKQHLIKHFSDLDWQDVGTFGPESVDYPDFATLVVNGLREQEPMDPKVDAASFGVLICGSSQGMAIKANRSPWIRAAICWNEEVARLARAHNNANVLCLAARFVDSASNEKIVRAFLTTAFEGGRHQARVDKL